MSQRTVRAIVSCGLFAVTSWSTTSAVAQDPAMVQLYGGAVHEYFSGNYQQALADLTLVADSESTDPRVFYFRGLVQRRMGMSDAAQEDFAKGAELEAKAVDRFYPVSRSLERVQGADRLAVEKFRARARALAYQEKQKRDQSRYEQIRRSEAAVLRDAPIAAPAEPAAQPKAGAAAPAAPAEADPFAEPAEKPAEEPAAEADPFADESKPAEEATEDAPAAAEKKEDDPFADDADAAPAEEAPAEEAPAEEAPAEEAPAEEKKPDTKEKEADDDNPFGN
jgi:hypothetical protein